MMTFGRDVRNVLFAALKRALQLSGSATNAHRCREKIGRVGLREHVCAAANTADAANRCRRRVGVRWRGRV